MPTTTNFGWTTPADTDYVTDGANAMRTLGDGIDTSLADLKGGTTGQVLSKASNTDLDYTFITKPGWTLISTTSLSGTAVNLSSLPTTYRDLVMVVINPAVSSSGSIYFRWNGNTGSTYSSISSVVTTTTVTTTGATATSSFPVANSASTSALNAYAEIRVCDYLNTTTNKLFTSSYVINSTTNAVQQVQGSFRGSSVATTSLTIGCTAGVFSSGSVLLYGVI